MFIDPKVKVVFFQVVFDDVSVQVSGRSFGEVTKIDEFTSLNFDVFMFDEASPLLEASYLLSLKHVHLWKVVEVDPRPLRK